MTDNERIAKYLGWHQQTLVGEWYSTPDGARLAHPPQFEVDWKLWHSPRGVLAVIAESEEKWSAFAKAIRAKLTAAGLRRPCAVLLATPAQLSVALGSAIKALEEEADAV